jgi:hypothetical protein
MAEKRTKGFHALEKKIHDMEEKDRTAAHEPGAKREAGAADEKAPVVPPPAAHDE